MLRRILISLGAILLAFVFLVFAEEPPTTPEPAGATDSAGGGGGGSGGGGGGGNDSDSNGDEIWSKWNDTGMSENDTSWLVKYCPRDLTPAFEKFCQMHCWWNGWQGGFCTDDDICICKWDGLMLDPEMTGVKTVSIPPGAGGGADGNNTSGDPGSGGAGGDTTTTEDSGAK